MNLKNNEDQAPATESVVVEDSAKLGSSPAKKPLDGMRVLDGNTELLELIAKERTDEETAEVHNLHNRVEDLMQQVRAVDFKVYQRIVEKFKKEFENAFDQPHGLESPWADLRWVKFKFFHKNHKPYSEKGTIGDPEEVHSIVNSEWRHTADGWVKKG